MKKLYLSCLFAVGMLSLFPTTAYSQSSCPNLNFSYGNYTNWTEYYRLLGDSTRYNNHLTKKIFYVPYPYIVSGCLDLTIPGYNYIGHIGTGTTFFIVIDGMEYEMIIDTNNAFLVIHYAWVSVPESFSNHNCDSEFTIRLRNSIGNSLNIPCGEVNIKAQKHINDSSFCGIGFNRGQNWTQIEYDLSAFVGQTIKISFEVQDFTLGHIGAWFVADCRSAKSTMPQPPTELYICPHQSVARLEAPHGYSSYTWIRSSDTAWKPATRQVVAFNALDGEIFTCICGGCELKYEIVIKKTRAIADFASRYDTCNHTATFVDFSRVRNGVKDSILWEIPALNVKSSDSLFTYTFPKPTGNQPDTYKVCLTVFENECNSTDTMSQYIIIYLPMPQVITKTDTLCYGEIYNDGNFNNLTAAGTYSNTLQNINGCDSIIELTLGYYPSIPITNYSASICEGKVYNDANFSNLTTAGTYSNTLQNINSCDSVIELTLTYYSNATATNYSASTCENVPYTDGNFSNLTQAGIYYNTLPNIKGCDSVICLTLTVNPTTKIDSIYANSKFLCEGDELRIEAIATGENLVYQWYQDGDTLFGEQNRNLIVSAVTQSHNGTYNVEVIGICGKATSKKITIDASGANILVEKWHDVVFVDNSSNQFVGYQWYRDGKILNGATEQFYQEVGGLNGCYSVELYLAGRSGSIRSCQRCAYKTSKEKSIFVYPNPVIGQLTVDNGELTIENIQIYDIVGKLLQSKIVNLQSEIVLDVSHLASGMYYLKVDNKVIKFVKE